MSRKPGIGKRQTIDTNAKVFHTVQRTVMKLPLLESDEVYEYRAKFLRIYCMEENVTVICDILMGTHAHTILYAEHYSAILRVFQRLNTGLSAFVWKNIIEGSEYEKLYDPPFHYKLFSSSIRMFPIEGRRALFIDTRYLFDNPRHHNCNSFGLLYSHSSFRAMQNGEFSKKDVMVFYSLYGMFPKQVFGIITKRYQDFMRTLDTIESETDPVIEASTFRIDPQKEWRFPFEQVTESYKRMDH